MIKEENSKFIKITAEGENYLTFDDIFFHKVIIMPLSRDLSSLQEVSKEHRDEIVAAQQEEERKREEEENKSLTIK